MKMIQSLEVGKHYRCTMSVKVVDPRSYEGFNFTKDVIYICNAKNILMDDFGKYINPELRGFLEAFELFQESIKLDDVFVCIKDVSMTQDEEEAFTAGLVYVCEVEGYLTNNQGEKYHEITWDFLLEHFKNIKDEIKSQTEVTPLKK